MRRHPVLGYSKMHKGVDFAAPTGTPIMAAGNGTIRMARWNGSFGKYVRIAHANGYETAYAHLSRIAPGVREGARVRQGQVIGRVGTTGRSTGPHLHYEVMVRNRQINPMDVKLPTGTTLAGAELAAFKAMVARVNLVLDKWGETPAVVAQGEILRAKLLP
jgi:murein DD-endopeptidase MepM/ murein hydrolase activator NlpD